MSGGGKHSISPKSLGSRVCSGLGSTALCNYAGAILIHALRVGARHQLKTSHPAMLLALLILGLVRVSVCFEFTWAPPTRFAEPVGARSLSRGVIRQNYIDPESGLRFHLQHDTVEKEGTQIILLDQLKGILGAACPQEPGQKASSAVGCRSCPEMAVSVNWGPNPSPP